MYKYSLATYFSCLLEYLSELDDVEGLREEAVHAGLETLIFKSICGVCCQRCDVGLPRTRLVPEVLTDRNSGLEPIHDRHVAIHENEPVIVSTLFTAGAYVNCSFPFAFHDSLDSDLAV